MHGRPTEAEEVLAKETHHFVIGSGAFSLKSLRPRSFRRAASSSLQVSAISTRSFIKYSHCAGSSDGGIIVYLTARSNRLSGESSFVIGSFLMSWIFEARSSIIPDKFEMRCAKVSSEGEGGVKRGVGKAWAGGDSGVESVFPGIGESSRVTETDGVGCVERSFSCRTSSSSEAQRFSRRDKRSKRRAWSRGGVAVDPVS